MEKLRKHLFIFLSIAVILLSFISFGKAKDYYFWRDDTFVVWAGKYQPHILGREQMVRNRFLGTSLNLWFYTDVVGDNATYWQYTGLILKIVNSLLLFYLLKNLTGSIFAGVLIALYYASFMGGLEAYTWARLIAFEISLVLLTFTFYIRSYHKKSWKLFAAATAISLLSLSMELWRTFAIVGIIPLWELCTYWSGFKIMPLKTSIKRIAIFLVANVFFINFVLAKTGETGSKSDLVSGYTNVLASTVRAGNLEFFERSLGNEVRSIVAPVQEEGGLSAGDIYSRNIGIGFILLGALFVAVFIVTRKSWLIVPVTFFFWILMFYFPNWLYESTLTIGATHRYLAISAVGLAIICVYLIQKLNRTFQIVAFLILMTIGLLSSIKVVDGDYEIRGRLWVEPLLSKISQTVPPGEKKSVLNIWGNHKLRGYVFDWGGPYLLTYSRGIASFEDFPIFVNNTQGASLLCDPNTIITNWKNGGVKKAGEVSKLDKYYGFYVNNYGILEDRTSEFRLEVAKNAPCLAKKQQKLTSSDLSIESTTFIRNLETGNNGKMGLIVNWQHPVMSKNSEYSYVLFLTDTLESKTVEIQSGSVSFLKGESVAQSTVIFGNDLISPLHIPIKTKLYSLAVMTCPGSCNFTKTILSSVELAL